MNRSTGSVSHCESATGITGTSTPAVAARWAVQMPPVTITCGAAIAPRLVARPVTVPADVRMRSASVSTTKVAPAAAARRAKCSVAPRGRHCASPGLHIAAANAPVAAGSSSRASSGVSMRTSVRPFACPTSRSSRAWRTSSSVVQR